MTLNIIWKSKPVEIIKDTMENSNEVTADDGEKPEMDLYK